MVIFPSVFSSRLPGRVSLPPCRSVPNGLGPLAHWPWLIGEKVEDGDLNHEKTAPGICKSATPWYIHYSYSSFSHSHYAAFFQDSKFLYHKPTRRLYTTIVSQKNGITHHFHRNAAAAFASSTDAPISTPQRWSYQAKHQAIAKLA